MSLVNIDGQYKPLVLLGDQDEILLEPGTWFKIIWFYPISKQYIHFYNSYRCYSVLSKSFILWCNKNVFICVWHSLTISTYYVAHYLRSVVKFVNPEYGVVYLFLSYWRVKPLTFDTFNCTLTKWVHIYLFLQG